MFTTNVSLNLQCLHSALLLFFFCLQFSKSVLLGCPSSAAVEGFMHTASVVSNKNLLRTPFSTNLCLYFNRLQSFSDSWIPL